jgi:AP-3 complex subunit sigma
MQVFVESLDRAFENVCELDLVFQLNEVFHFGKDIPRGIYTPKRFIISWRKLFREDWFSKPMSRKLIAQVCCIFLRSSIPLIPAKKIPVQLSAKLRKESFASANPLSLGIGVDGAGARGGNLKSPLGWLTNKITGARAM